MGMSKAQVLDLKNFDEWEWFQKWDQSSVFQK